MKYVKNLGYLTDERKLSEQTIQILFENAVDVTESRLCVRHSNNGQLIYINGLVYEYDLLQFSEAEIFFRKGLQTLLIYKNR
jgi:hypothetical protein